MASARRNRRAEAAAIKRCHGMCRGKVQTEVADMVGLDHTVDCLRRLDSLLAIGGIHMFKHFISVFVTFACFSSIAATDINKGFKVETQFGDSNRIQHKNR